MFYGSKIKEIIIDYVNFKLMTEGELHIFDAVEFAKEAAEWYVKNKGNFYNDA